MGWNGPTYHQDLTQLMTMHRKFGSARREKSEWVWKFGYLRVLYRNPSRSLTLSMNLLGGTELMLPRHRASLQHTNVFSFHGYKYHKPKRVHILPEISAVRSPDLTSQKRIPPSRCPVTAIDESMATSTLLAVELCRNVEICRYVCREMSQTFKDRSADPVMTFFSLSNNRTQVILWAWPTRWCTWKHEG